MKVLQLLTAASAFAFISATAQAVPQIFQIDLTGGNPSAPTMTFDIPGFTEDLVATALPPVIPVPGFGPIPSLITQSGDGIGVHSLAGFDETSQLDNFGLVREGIAFTLTGDPDFEFALVSATFTRVGGFFTGSDDARLTVNKVSDPDFEYTDDIPCGPLFSDDDSCKVEFFDPFDVGAGPFTQALMTGNQFVFSTPCGIGPFGCLGFDDYKLSEVEWEVEVAAVPEPATMTLFGLGLIGLGYARRRKQA